MRVSLGGTRYSISMRQLSSRLTLFYKYIAPVLWIGGLGWLTLRVFLHPTTRAAGFGLAKWVLLFCWLAGTVSFLRRAVRLKRVRLDGDFLLISNYFAETRIPIATLVDVHQDDEGLKTIALGFKDPQPFQGRIEFVPARPRDLLVWSDDWALTELRRLTHIDSDEGEARAT